MNLYCERDRQILIESLIIIPVPCLETLRLTILAILLRAEYLENS